MNTAFDMLGSVSPGRNSWRFKVRVLRLWNAASFMKPDQPNSIEMVLIDEKGSKIHASVRRQLIYVFGGKIAEGKVYKMSYFSVVPESGLFRSTQHPYKLKFEMKTKVQICENNSIDTYGLSLSTIGDIFVYGPEHDFLIDVAAVVTGVSGEREYIRDGKVVKMVLLELTDNSGKCECAFFGDYVDILQEMLVNAGAGLPIVVVQFAKIKIFAGKVSIQNVVNATRIFVNPPIPEIVSLKKDLDVDGLESAVSIPVLGPRVATSFEDDFLLNFPKTTLAKLVGLAEDGIYVVSASVVDLVDPEEWWYPSCRCHRSLTADSGAYYCKFCVKHVFKMVPRFRVKLRVDDGTSEAVFVVFDADMHVMVGRHCFEMVLDSKARDAGFYPPEFDLLKGKKFLFKVQKSYSGALRFDDSYRVKRVCSDEAIIKAFEVAVSGSGYDGDNEVSGEEESVQNAQSVDVAGVVTITPNLAKGDDEFSDDEEIVVSTGDFVNEVIDLGDDSTKDLDVFLPGRVALDPMKAFSAKRNLSAAFAECDNTEESTSQIRKHSQG
ncbi:hypothetical protein P8452_47925 [Trifolium repens]|nr:hypothetical protein P8452_47925 [Trifolium repens]